MSARLLPRAVGAWRSEAQLPRLLSPVLRSGRPRGRALFSVATSPPPSFEDVLLECNNLNSLAHVFWARIVQPGDTVVDATAGNGGDALALAHLALTASSGSLLALDVQEAAVVSTREHLAAHLQPGQLARCSVQQACHSRLAELLPPASCSLVCFNLGFFPVKRGASNTNKAIVTAPATTYAALTAAAALLRVGGCISCMVYTGHSEGPAEAAAVDSWAAGLPPRQWTATSVVLLNRVNAPRLVLAYKRHCGAV